MGPLLQRFHKDRNKQKNDANAQNGKSDNAQKQRNGRKGGHKTTTVVGASANKTLQKHKKEQKKDQQSSQKVTTSTSSAGNNKDPDLSLRLSTTQEDLLKDVSLYVKEHDAVASAGQAVATTSPSANTATTVPASPLVDTPDGANKGSAAENGRPTSWTLPSTLISTMLPSNLAGNISAISVRDEEEDDGEDKDEEGVRTGHRAPTGTTTTPTVRPEARSLRNEFDSVRDDAILSDVEDYHGDPEFARHGATGVEGFIPMEEINGTSGSITNRGPSHRSDTRKKASTATTRKVRTADTSFGQDLMGSSYDDSYSYSDSYEEEDEKLPLADEIIDFLCCDFGAPTFDGDRRRSRSATAPTSHRRRGSSSRRHDRNRPPRDGGNREMSKAPRSRRHK